MRTGQCGGLDVGGRMLLGFEAEDMDAINTRVLDNVVKTTSKTGVETTTILAVQEA